MPLPGGDADKVGNAYELLWIADCLTKILAGRAQRIRLEPVGPEGKGVEFWLDIDGQREYHQAKRQQAGKGRWSIADLASILANFKAHLDRNTAGICIFVSTEAASGLRELTERAQGAQHPEEFLQFFLEAKDVADDFSRLKETWKCSSEQGWALLKRIRVETVSHNRLGEDVVSKLAHLVTGDADTVATLLLGHALDQIHQIIDEASLWQFLDEREHHPTNWAKNASAVLAVRTQAEHYLEAENSAIQYMERAETEQVYAAFIGEQARRQVFLTGEAGTGKSGVVAAIIRRFQEQGWPVLPFRLDRLEPVATTRELGTQLGLSDSPVAVLDGIAVGKDCLLVVDQLDAVSQVSGRNPQFFHCFERLLIESRVCSSMRVLIVCRGFDLENDSRLRKLAKAQPEPPRINVGRLSHDAVSAAVSAMGAKAADLTPGQLELLSLPLHLVLLANVIERNPARALTFQTALDLYDGFWEEKRQTLAGRLGRKVDWVPVIRLLATTMSNRQTLSIDADALIDYEDDVQAMVSEHVLRRDGRRLSFFHEGFFDYAFARLFDGSIEDLVLQGEQHLFRRGQVRQILLYRHAQDPAIFQGDVDWLIRGPRVRFHLRQTTILVLSELPSPDDGEWRLLEPLLTCPDDRLRRWSRRALFGKGWGRYLCQTGKIDLWLLEGGDDRQFALNILSNLAATEPRLVAEKLSPFIDAGEEWQQSIIACLGRHEAVIKDDDAWALVLRLSELAKISRYSLDGWADKAPERCCILLARQLLMRGEQLDDAIKNRREDFPFAKLAETAPAPFIDNLLPITLSAIEKSLYERQTKSGLKGDQFHWNGAIERYSGLHEHLFNATSQALGSLAQIDSDKFRLCTDQLKGRPWQTAQVILCKALDVAGKDVAQYAADVVLGLFQNYAVGEHDTILWAVHDVIASMAPHWDDEILSAVETHVLTVRAHWEGRKDGYKMRGRGQRLLLEALSDARLSHVGQRRLSEWRRMPNTIMGRPWGVRGGYVQSPLDADVTAKMNDDQWLSAIARYRDSHIRNWLEDRILGGAEQLANELSARTKDDPKRYACLMLRFLPDTPPDYIRGVLRGLQEAETLIDLEIVLPVLRKAHEMADRSLSDPIVSLIAKYGKIMLLPELVCMLENYAADPDPSVDEWLGDVNSGKVIYDGQPLTQGINSVRGEVARAVASLLFADHSNIAALEGVAERLLDDPIVAVRACAIEICTALLNIDRDRAVQAFLRLVAVDDELLVQHTSFDFLRYGLWSHHKELRLLIERLLCSEFAERLEMGAVYAALIHLRHSEEGEDLANSAITSSVSARKGMADVYSANWEVFPSLCQGMLIPLFHDDDTEVRSKAAHFIWSCDLDSDAIRPLVSELINSPAFLEACHGLFHRLEQTPGYQPELLMMAVDRFLQVASAEASDIRTHHAATAHEVGELVVRAYSQATDPTFRSACLDRIDALIGNEAFGIDSALEKAGR